MATETMVVVVADVAGAEAPSGAGDEATTGQGRRRPTATLGVIKGGAAEADTAVVDVARETTSAKGAIWELDRVVNLQSRAIFSLRSGTESSKMHCRSVDEPFVLCFMYYWVSWGPTKGFR